MMLKAKELLRTTLIRLSDMKPGRTTLNSKAGLIRRLRRSREARAQFVSSHVDKTVAFQLRAIRDRQGLSQEDLAEVAEMNQNAVSRLESEWYGKPTIRTLKRLAAALDVALVVRFVPFSQLVDWVSGTPFVDEGLSTESLAVPNFHEEETRLRGVARADTPTQGLAAQLDFGNAFVATTNYDELLSEFQRIDSRLMNNEQAATVMQITAGSALPAGLPAQPAENEVSDAYLNAAVVATSEHDQFAALALH